MKEEEEFPNNLVHSFQLLVVIKTGLVKVNFLLPPSSCTHIAGYLLKNSPELLVLFALFPCRGWRWLRCQGAAKHRDGIKDERKKNVNPLVWCAVVITIKHKTANDNSM